MHSILAASQQPGTVADIRAAYENRDGLVAPFRQRAIHRLQTLQRAGHVEIRVTFQGCAPEEDDIVLKDVGNRKGLGSWDPSRAAVLDRPIGDPTHRPWNLQVDPGPEHPSRRPDVQGIRTAPGREVLCREGNPEAHCHLAAPCPQYAWLLLQCELHAFGALLEQLHIKANAAVAGIQEAKEQI